MPFLCVIFFIVFCSSCGGDSRKVDEISFLDFDPTSKNVEDIPIWGYRFQLTGYFDGDKKLDTLTERLIDMATGLETNRYFEGDEDIFYQGYDFYQRVSYLEGKTSLLPLGSNIGLHWAETVGDIDGNGTDEIMLVINGADYSNMNDFYIYTFKGEVWQVMYHHQTMEYLYPVLPSISFLPKDLADSNFIPFYEYQYYEGVQNFKLITLVAKNKIEFLSRIDHECEETFELAFPTTGKKPAYYWAKTTAPQKDTLVEQILLKYPKPNDYILKELKAGTFELCDCCMEFDLQVTFKPTP